MRASDPFLVERANILIRSILNKKAIEKLYSQYAKSFKKDVKPSISLDDFMKEGMSELPYFLENGHKIYVPVFPRSINSIYESHFEKLLVAPYMSLLEQYEALMVDPFDYYGNAIYDSYFTKFVAIKRKEGVLVSYDFDAEALYFINDEGRLDSRLALFDKYIEKSNKTHMVGRLQNVANAYFIGDRQILLASLLDNGFLSEKMFSKLGGKERSISTPLPKE
jgi:hypothetical protein